jgi:type I restriction enzyme, S subunit
MSSELKPGWRRVKFGDVVRQVKDKVDPEDSGLERYIAGEHMDTDDLKLRRWGEIGAGHLGPAFHMRFKPGHVLYGSRRTYLRKVAVADFEGITANTTFVLEPKDPSVLLPELLPILMQTERFNEHSIKQSRGSVNPYVNFSDLAWYELALPPLEEQRRCVRLLTLGRAAYDSVIDCAEAQARLEETFCICVRSRMDFPLIKLGDVAQFTSGKSKRVTSLPEISSDSAPIPVYGGNGISGWCNEDLAGLPPVFPILGRVGQYCGVAHLVTSPAWVTDNALYPKAISKSTLPEYLLICLKGARLNRSKLGEYLPLITQKVVHQTRIPIPALGRQQELVAAYEEIVAGGDLVQSRIATAAKSLRGLTSELMGGQE